MGRVRSLSLDTNFTYFIHPIYKGQRAKCKHCSEEKTADAKRQHDHLKTCKEYKVLLSHKEKDTVERVARKKQLRISYHLITKEQMIDLQKLAVAVCYEDVLPFTLWQSTAMKAFLYALNPSFKPPNRNVIGGDMLTEAYTTK